MSTSGSDVTATTPIELVAEVYGRLPERVALGRDRLGPALTLAERSVDLVHELDGGGGGDIAAGGGHGRSPCVVLRLIQV